MDRSMAEELLQKAKSMNDGAWIEHSYNVARLAEKIADKAGMDSEHAYIIGLLHDIGRRNGNMQARHAIEGYQFLSDIGFEEGARICLTHTFQYKDVEAIYDTWDCTDKYFYGTESEMLTFYRIPKLLVTSAYFKTLTNDAKMLYGLMLDRMSLSARNHWFD